MTITIQRTVPGRARAWCARCDMGIASKTDKVQRWALYHTSEHQQARWN